MAKEIKRRFNTAARQVVIEVEDDFGHISQHSIPLAGDKCPHCGSRLPGTNGSADVNASALAIVKDIDDQMPGLIRKFELAAQGDHELMKHIQAAKAKRNGHI